MKKMILFSIATCLFFCMACKKDKDKTLTKTEMITAGSYNLTAVRSDNDGDGIYEDDDYATFDACFKDNYYSFRTDGKVEMNEGATKCDPMDPQTELNDWHFASNETRLVIGTGSFVIDYSIEVLDNTTLRIKEDWGGGSSMLTFTKR